MISHSLEVAEANYVSSTSSGVDAGLLTFVQYGSVYNGTSSTAPLLARSSTGNVSGQEYVSPVSFGPNGMYVVPATSGTTSAIVHFK